MAQKVLWLCPFLKWYKTTDIKEREKTSLSFTPPYPIGSGGVGVING